MQHITKPFSAIRLRGRWRSGGRLVSIIVRTRSSVTDDEPTRWAIDVMTAWLEHGHDADFVHHRIADYVGAPGGREDLVTGLINLAGLLLSGLELTIGKDSREILQTIARTLERAR
jgi:hypothetical protein